MAALASRLWMLSFVCCLLTVPAARADSNARAPEPSLRGDNLPPPPAYRAYPDGYPAAYPDMDAALTVLDQAVAAVAAADAASRADPQPDTVEATVQESVQGMVWVLALCFGLMILAGFNSRKPRPPHYPLDAGRTYGNGKRTHHAGDPEPEDDAWREP